MRFRFVKDQKRSHDGSAATGRWRAGDWIDTALMSFQQELELGGGEVGVEHRDVGGA